GDTGDGERQEDGRPGVVGGNAAGHHEDAGADDGPDAERGEADRAEDAPQPVLAACFFEQGFQGFLGEQLLEHTGSRRKAGKILKARSTRTRKPGTARQRRPWLLPWISGYSYAGGPPGVISPRSSLPSSLCFLP